MAVFRSLLLHETGTHLEHTLAHTHTIPAIGSIWFPFCSWHRPIGVPYVTDTDAMKYTIIVECATQFASYSIRLALLGQMNRSIQYTLE